MRWIADLVYLLAGLAYSPVAIYHALFLGKNRRGWVERFGGVPCFSSERRRVWIHAVSLGEMNATPRLAAAIAEAAPDLEVVFSTTTDTGYRRGLELYGADRVFRFPLDFSWVVSRTLRRVNPAMIVLVELEVWYNLVVSASRRGIPVVVVNGRLTARSARRLAWLGAVGRSMFRSLSWVGAQDDTIAARFRALGVPPERLEVTGSMKWDTAQIADAMDGADALGKALGFDGSRPVWVCGSTGPGEEGVILDAYRKVLAMQSASADRTPMLVIVPRKPERFDEVSRLIEQSGFACVRRSRRPDGEIGASLLAGAVVLGDSLGELRKFYSLADVVFVGRSLVRLGGSDPMEVAALGKPMVAGSFMDNFEAPVRALRDAQALTVVHDASALADAVSEILANATRAEALGQKARETVLQHQGATQRTARQLARVLTGVGTSASTDKGPSRRSTSPIAGQTIDKPGTFSHSV